MKYLILVLLPVICSAGPVWDPFFGLKDKLKSIPVSKQLECLQALRGSQLEMAGGSQIDLLLTSLRSLDSLERLPSNELKLGLLHAVNTDPAALEFLNAYIAYTNELLALTPDAAKLELIRTTRFRSLAIKHILETPQSLDLNSAVSALTAMFTVVMETPELTSNNEFLHQLVWAVSDANGSNVPAQLLIQARVWRAEQSLALSEETYRMLIARWSIYTAP